MKTFDTEQLTRFKEYTAADLVATEAKLKGASGDEFKAAFALMNALNDQSALIQQHIDAPKPQKKEKSGGETTLTPAQQRAADKAAKDAAKNQSANT